MNGVLGMTELALTTDLTAEQREYLELVKGSAESLLTLLDDLLDLSKVEAGRMELNPAPFDLRALIADSMRPMEVRGSARGIDVSWQVAKDAPQWINGDKGRLRQVLLNLVGNSVKFTDAGWVRLEVACLGRVPPGKSRLRFTVQDSGIGIGPEKLGAIFDPFTQLAGESGARRGGTGLGLSISGKLVELMGGRLFVASSAGEGAAFSFTLDFPTVAAPEAAKGLPGHRPVAPRPIPLRCLVAEDHPVNQRLMAELLKKAGWECEVVASGQAAVEANRARHFDIVLMDIQMPGMDGLEATRVIREEERASGRRIPIVAMTAHAMPGDRERCLEAGMDGYLAKPIRPAELIQEIQRVTQDRTAAAPRPPAEGETGNMNTLVDSEAALARVGGDSQLLSELAGLFLEEYPRLLAGIDEGIRSGNLDAARSGAHQLKGLLAQFGCEQGRLIAIELEDAAKQGDSDAAAGAAARISRFMDGAKGELEQLARTGGQRL
jgi:CheY-like chemotaxis protein/HPt (histidine-containing phosphotransfer) domain-containing protein